MIHDSESGVYCIPLKGMLFCSARQLNYQRTFFHMPDLKRVFVGAGQSRFWPSSSGTTFLDCGWTSALLHPVSLLWAWIAASPSPAQPLTLSSQTWSSCSWFRLPEGVSARAFPAKDPQEVPGRVLGPSFARRSLACLSSSGLWFLPLSSATLLRFAWVALPHLGLSSGRRLGGHGTHPLFLNALLMGKFVWDCRKDTNR